MPPGREQGSGKVVWVQLVRTEWLTRALMVVLLSVTVVSYMLGA
jgi:hypothetical protein